ncbi:MAG: hypothetical protein GEV28_02620 [Actinophytocola sp.]|uniref:hypothetical protein n=1 Tax=Actinophytocola sp. TaxID=1872138 RepID=UPI001326A338|nr:hypothetical protein [Actinophytocola sp.]MPZ79329.1 hypothetical protein [Actinophytocola sp.]
MRRVVIIVLGLGALAGCTGQQVSGVPIGSTLAPPTTTAVTTTEPPPAEPTFPKAADGSNLQACFDGTCEVDVRAPVQLDMDPATGVSHLSIPTIGPQGVHIEGQTAGGGTITIDLYADPGAFAESVINNQLSISTMATVDGRALLRLRPV